MDAKTHWENVYGIKAPDGVSWYAPHLEQSLAYIQRTGLKTAASIIDVGGGEATLVDDLLDSGYDDVSVLDVSSKALEVCKARLGERASQVRWMTEDVLKAVLPARRYDVWHDRAVFHFLTNRRDREAYVRQVLNALRPGGFAIVGTFGPQGPTACSGLPVARYGADELHEEFGGRFTLVESSEHVHMTPWGAPQQFVYCFCRLEH
jgi:SAM-dependent methyltransferase